MAAKQKYYVVWRGRQPGIYDNWSDCERQVKGYAGASFKSFKTKEEAKKAFETGTNDTASYSKMEKSSSTYIENSVSVDVGSHGNPGFVEYKGVYTKDGKILFSHPGIQMGTNNLGEFLAIVHALQYLTEQGSDIPVYTDSDTALIWVRKGKANSSLKRTKETEEIWNLVENAESWLKNNNWNNRLLKWNTKAWGEIKADYGRK